MILLKSLPFLLLALFFFFFFSHAMGQLIPPAALEMFVDELPCMPKLQGFQVHGGKLVPAHLTVSMYQKTWKFHRDLPPTTVFAFGTSIETATVPGPAIEAMQGVATYVTWENHLPPRHILPFDPTVTTAKPKSGVPTVVHLHGGIHPPASDGNADAWFTNSFQYTGPSFVSRTSFYPNVQEPGNLWYHDHTTGLTRVNLLTGLFGTYIVRNHSLEAPLNLPSGPEFDRHIVVIDRSFLTDGSIFLNATGVNPSIHPQWQPGYFGEVILVNGKAWPYLKVARRRYRFRIINACNARYLSLFFPDDDGLKFVHIGSDSTYIANPVASTKFTLGPSEIADVIVDFSESSRDSVVLSNNARYPYPNGTSVDQFNGQIMKFIIQNSNSTDPSRIPTSLIQYPAPAVNRAATKRYITMTELDSASGNAIVLLLNNKTFEDPVTDTPKVGTSEVWYVINLTTENHPLHIHLALSAVLKQIELVNLTAFQNCMTQMNDAIACNVSEHAKGQTVDVPVYERGWKNVFKIMPGYVTTIVVQFSLLDGTGYPFPVIGEPGYVYHCHIVDHEDNAMMRPLKLVP